MKRLPAVEAAINKIKALQHFVELAQHHPEKNLFNKSNKLYAFTGSLKETTKIINEERAKFDLPLIEESTVREAIISTPKDPLHKLLKTNCMIESRPSRRKS